LTKSWANQQRVIKIVKAFEDESIHSYESLNNIWKSNPKFILSEYLLWVPELAHPLLKNNWPPVSNGVWKTGLVKECQKLVKGVAFKRGTVGSSSDSD
jgi:hypothetical protein